MITDPSKAARERFYAGRTLNGERDGQAIVPPLRLAPWLLAAVVLLVCALATLAQERVTVTWPATGGTNLVMLDGVEQTRTTGTNATIEVPFGREFCVSIVRRPATDGGDYTGRYIIEAVPRWGHPQFRDGTNWITVPLATGQRVEPTNAMQLFRAVMTRNREVVGIYRNWQGTNEVVGRRYAP